MAFPHKLLTENETIVFDMHPHWKVLVDEALKLAILVGLAVLVKARIDASWTNFSIGLGVVVWTLMALPDILKWRFTDFTLTNERLISRRGVIAKNSKEIPLETINTVTFDQSILGRMMGYGTLTVESAGENGQETFTNARKPEDMQKAIYTAAEARKHYFRTV